MTNRRLRFVVGAAYLVAGLAALGWAFFRFPFPDWRTLLPFALAHIALELRSAEVNDRLLASSGVMVALTAGIVFALQTDPSAPVAMGILAAVGPFTVNDLRRKHVFQPVVNFGQLVLTAVAVGWVLNRLLAGVGTPIGADFVRIAGAGAVAALVYTFINLTQVAVIVRYAYGRRNVVAWSGMTRLVTSHALMGLLGGALGGVFRIVSTPGSDEGSFAILPLVLVVFFIGHMAFASYAQLREAHESTLRGFVKSLEARDLYTRGHTERVAMFTQIIGAEMGFTGTQLEQVRFAALIHDVGKLAVPADIIRKKGALDDDEYREMQVSAHRIENLLAEVEFLSPAVSLASAYHPRVGSREDVGSAHTHSDNPSLEARVMVVADAFDAMTSTRSYRMAMSQEQALASLRNDSAPVFDGFVIDALERALIKLGQRYGPPTLTADLADSVTETEHA